METTINEIAPDIFRLSTYIPDIAPPAGFTFNQILVAGEEPFLFHTGMRGFFPLVSAAVDKVVGLERLRWISFGHIEADECGAMNEFLAAAPNAQITHGPLACMVSINDMADRAPVPAGETPLDIGGHALRFIATPHVPHNWESGLWFDETTKTLLCGDLFTSLGDTAALVETDLVEGAMVAQEVFQATSHDPNVGATMRALAELEPQTLACMHGSSFRGDGAAQLRAMADHHEASLVG
jgi:flavorubredoxin